MNKLINTYHKIINYGVGEHNNAGENVKNRFINGILFWGAFITIFNIVAHTLMTGSLYKGGTYLALTTVFFCVVILLLNKNKHYKVARFVIVILMHSILLMHVFFLDHRLRFDIVSLLFITMFPLFYDKLKTLIINIVVSGVIVLTSYYLQSHNLINSINVDPNYKTTNIATYVIVVSMISVVLMHFIKVNKEYQNQVELKNKDLEQSLIEKEVLLKEVHHRVKNNLQIIHSMLDLQMEKVTHPETKKSIEDSKTRVMSMALIHQRLYATDSLSKVSMKDYLERLIETISNLNQNGSYEVMLNINIQELYFDLDKSIPIGLIVNELVTNAYKYAFEAADVNKLEIVLKSCEKNSYCLMVKDSGSNFENNTSNNNESLGLLLVTTLVNQIGGEIDFQQEAVGLKVELKFS